ncbi:Histidine phosphatase superfamily clade-1 [Penicillium citrinum]|uniref:Histidine phosphatase superfamily clade-1 n=2 Tax=Penicillium TaxID=5073 RepID=A0A9W9P5E1_PENCI|nr:Histidine phosphatase superfamily clade-1 [Penicillium citrinum]KAJ5235652.1 Histidine phosphatase superfamily clade-1 [Penicillium citrinum]KAJ5591216.1 Histidine phosphatase superfamily clade-1 [Penicillium hetheringtonii]
MGKPRMIILVRHAQSEGNKNRDIHQTTPDHRVKLTPEGHRQAQEAGRRLRDLLHPDDTLHFFTSPYRRTRETTEGMLESLTSDSPDPSPFPRHTIKVYEEPRLREQDFGNFQPCSTEMERMWMERADYGHFFYRIPNGESAADAYDRVSGFNESLWRLFGEEDTASVCVLVTHGLMTRVFLMKWYHWSVEYFEDLRNINHCEFVIMTHNPDNGKYALQNKLRTWSDLRKERENERKAKGVESDPISPADNVPIRRKWGGCPDGCTHGLSSGARQSLRKQVIETVKQDHNNNHNHNHNHSQNGQSEESRHDIKKTDQPSSGSLKSPVKHNKSLDNSFSFPASEKAHQHNSNTNDNNNAREVSESNQEPANGDSNVDNTSLPRGTHSEVKANGTRPTRPHLHSLQRDSEDHLLHPPALSSSTACLKMALLHLGGRDGGGSMSGANSLAPSDDECSDTEHHIPRTVTHKLTPHHHHHSQFHPESGSNPSQDFSEDGDDELSTHPTEDARKSRPHVHHHHHHTHHRHTSSLNSQPPHHRMANILGDGDDMSTHSQSEKSPSQHSGSEKHEKNDEKLSLEAQQIEDQSIRGSVY